MREKEDARSCIPSHALSVRPPRPTASVTSPTTPDTSWILRSLQASANHQETVREAVWYRMRSEFPAAASWKNCVCGVHAGWSAGWDMPGGGKLFVPRIGSPLASNQAKRFRSRACLELSLKERKVRLLRIKPNMAPIHSHPEWPCNTWLTLKSKKLLKRGSKTVLCMGGVPYPLLRDSVNAYRAYSSRLYLSSSQ